MNYVEKFLDGMHSVLNLNPSTFSGAIDIIAVEQPDEFLKSDATHRSLVGTLRSTPFHVRFGKVHIFNSSERTVYLIVNGEESGVCMRLAKEGEAYFIHPAEPGTSSPESMASPPPRKIVHRYTASDPSKNQRNRLQGTSPQNLGSSPPNRLSENRFNRSTPDYSTLLNQGSAERSISKSYSETSSSPLHIGPEWDDNAQSREDMLSEIVKPSTSLPTTSPSFPKAIPSSTPPKSVPTALSTTPPTLKSIGQSNEKEKPVAKSWKFGVDTFFRFFQSPKKPERMKSPHILENDDEIDESEGTNTEFYSHESSEEISAFQDEDISSIGAEPAVKAEKKLKETEEETDFFGFDAEEEEEVRSPEESSIIDPRKHSNLHQDSNLVNKALRNLAELEKEHSKMGLPEPNNETHSRAKSEVVEPTSVTPSHHGVPSSAARKLNFEGAPLAVPATVHQKTVLSNSMPTKPPVSHSVSDDEAFKVKKTKSQKEKRDKKEAKERSGAPSSPKKISKASVSDREAVTDKEADTREEDKEKKLKRRSSNHFKGGAIHDPSSIQLSRCGSILFDPDFDKSKRDTVFDEKKIEYDEYIAMLKKDTTFLFDPEIVFKIHGRYYPWPVAGPMMVSMLLFGKEITPEAQSLLLEDNNLLNEEASREERKKRKSEKRDRDLKEKESEKERERDKEKKDGQFPTSPQTEGRPWYNIFWSGSKKQSAAAPPPPPPPPLPATQEKSVSFAKDDMTKPKPASVAHSPTPSNEASQVIQMLNPTPAAGTTTTVSLSVATKTLDGEELVSEEVRQILYPDEEDTLTTDSDRERDSTSTGRTSPALPTDRSDRSDKAEAEAVQYRRSLKPTSDELKSLNLKPGANRITFIVRHHEDGTDKTTEIAISGSIFLWGLNDKIVISDIDGTITRSDVFGQILPTVFGQDWSQAGVAQLFTNVQNHGYRILYLTARAIGQASMTKGFLTSVIQEVVGPDGSTKQVKLPDGPVFMSPDRILQSFNREVILRTPHEFKVQCLKTVCDIFGADNCPFYAGFGNRDTDTFAYRNVGVPDGRNFMINHFGEISSASGSFQNITYTKLNDLIDEVFPSLNPATAKTDAKFSEWNYWKDSRTTGPSLADIEAEILGMPKKK